MSPKKKKGTYCFICGYSNLIDKDNSEKIVYFSVTESRLSTWENLSKKPGFKFGSRVCSRHFDPVDISFGKGIGRIFFPLQRWHLRETAVRII